MPKRRLDARQLRDALASLGAVLASPTPIEIVIIGGGAAILAGLLERVTEDCDVVLHTPKAGWASLEAAVRRVADERGLPPDWLNAETETLAHRLPDGWRSRSTSVGRFGRLAVVAIGRADLIAMKLIAGRAVDLQDLDDLGVTAGEAAFARSYLEALRERYPGREGANVADALLILEEMQGEAAP